MTVNLVVSSTVPRLRMIPVEAAELTRRRKLRSIGTHQIVDHNVKARPERAVDVPAPKRR
jgi:hypothetical protein